MNFLIITHVPHFQNRNQFSAYAPYVNEMNVWAKEVKKLVIIAPLPKGTKTAIDSTYDHPNIQFIAVQNFNMLTASNAVKAMLELPEIVWKMYTAMQACDHIHLRCPGNMGLIGCFVQLLFPHKTKTAKYAGNWDPMATRPWTYRLQQKILSSTFLTRNMKVLIYGKWEDQTTNIKSFFTATYSQNEFVALQSHIADRTFQFLFVGTLVTGKNPLYAIQLVEQLKKLGHVISLKLYGEGVERNTLTAYITSKQLKEFVSLEGNKNREELKQAYQESQFVLLPSNSEGWPKAIAEGMFWGCVPIATAVSCVPYMLDNGNRGVLLEMDLKKDALTISNLLADEGEIQQKRRLANIWSTKFTMERFENEIREILNP